MAHRDRVGGSSGRRKVAGDAPASPQRTLRAENLGKPSLWVMISVPWYEAERRNPRAKVFSNHRDHSGIHGEIKQRFVPRQGIKISEIPYKLESHRVILRSRVPGPLFIRVYPCPSASNDHALFNRKNIGVET